VKILLGLNPWTTVLEKVIVYRLVKTYFPFAQPESWFLYSRTAVIVRCPKSHGSCLHPRTGLLFKNHFNTSLISSQLRLDPQAVSSLQIPDYNFVWIFHLSQDDARPNHHFHSGFIPLKLSGKQHRLWRSSLYNFLHAPVAFFLLGPNTAFSEAVCSKT
jgi:hypothetical protein